MAKDCVNDGNVNTCETPAGNTRITTIVVVTILVVGLVTVASVLVFLHFRRQRRDQREDKAFNTERADYGMDNIAMPAREPQYRQRADESPDPELAPPARRNSLQSLARSIRQLDDPFRTPGGSNTRDSSRDPFGENGGGNGAAGAGQR